MAKSKQSTSRGRSRCELLELFVRSRDEAAFTALVQRHGPMVLGVRRNILRDLHDAEDALQATFLVPWPAKEKRGTRSHEHY